MVSGSSPEVEYGLSGGDEANTTCVGGNHGRLAAIHGKNHMIVDTGTGIYVFGTV